MTPQTYSWPVDGPLQLPIRLGHGSLTIDAREDVTEAVVTLTPADADGLDRFTVDLRGRTLVVHAPRNSGWRHGRARLTRPSSSRRGRRPRWPPPLRTSR